VGAGHTIWRGDGRFNAEHECALADGLGRIHDSTLRVGIRDSRWLLNSSCADNSSALHQHRHHAEGCVVLHITVVSRHSQPPVTCDFGRQSSSLARHPDRSLDCVTHAILRFRLESGSERKPCDVAKFVIYDSFRVATVSEGPSSVQLLCTRTKENKTLGSAL